MHAEYDPEGFVHYLFGIAYDGNQAKYNRGVEKLQKKMKEGEFEVFIDYGEVSRLLNFVFDCYKV
jgi:hypothetical protein